MALFMHPVSRSQAALFQGFMSRMCSLPQGRRRRCPSRHFVLVDCKFSTSSANYNYDKISVNWIPPIARLPCGELCLACLICQRVVLLYRDMSDQIDQASPMHILILPKPTSVVRAPESPCFPSRTINLLSFGVCHRRVSRGGKRKRRHFFFL